MKTLLASTLAAAVVSSLVALSSDAHALGPVNLEIGIKGGIGTNPSSGPINPLNFGIGGRAGLSFMGLYGGVSVIDYFGQEVLGVSEHALLYGLEAGYGFDILIVKIRPQLGLGNLNLTGSFAGVDASSSHLYLEPGVTGLIKLGTMFVGADANVLLIPGLPDGLSTTTGTALTLHAQIGLMF